MQKLMSLEYAIEYPCEMRRRHGDPEMRVLGRKAALVSRIVNQTLETERSPSTESIEFTASLSEDVERAEEIAAYCREYCPAYLPHDLDGSAEDERLPALGEREPIGCLGRIRYPIQAAFEKFVAERVQLVADTAPIEEWPGLLRILLDPESPFDGELSKELRRVTTEENLRFFERRLPVSLTGPAARLTTDHIFDLFSGFLSTDEGVSGYQRELPVEALGDFQDFLEVILLHDLSPAEISHLQKTGTSYAQFLRLTRAIGRARSLGARLLLD